MPPVETPPAAARTPASCRPETERPPIPVDEEELRRWRSWLVGRGYKETTALLWLSRVRTAHARGATDEAAVDAVFSSFPGGTRSGFRQALRGLDEFRRSP